MKKGRLERLPYPEEEDVDEQMYLTQVALMKIRH